MKWIKTIFAKWKNRPITETIKLKIKRCDGENFYTLHDFYVALANFIGIGTKDILYIMEMDDLQYLKKSGIGMTAKAEKALEKYLDSKVFYADYFNKEKEIAK